MSDFALQFHFGLIDLIEQLVFSTDTMRYTRQLLLVVHLFRREDFASVGFNMSFQIVMFVSRNTRRQMDVLIDEDVRKVKFQ